ncbi:MAG TPA: nitrous oxide reductase accessory protein NosL [Thermodesulfobacteriota bacterium]|nr:nitrous oxide reductase accessory protein NosL [Thermodesulfobacteriota bacterium]
MKKSLSNTRRLILILAISSSFKRGFVTASDCRGNPCGCPGDRAGARPAPTVNLPNDRLLYALLKNRIGIKIAIFSFLLIIGCQSENTPVSINKGTDMCEYCRMMIDDFHYSAEIVTKGKVHKFDDIGCMMAYAQSNDLSLDKAHFWVMDFDSATWIKGDEAYYVLSPGIHTPMGYGIIAFKDQIKAKETEDKSKGEVKEFKSLFNIDWKQRPEH